MNEKIEALFLITTAGVGAHQKRIGAGRGKMSSGGNLALGKPGL